MEQNNQFIPLPNKEDAGVDELFRGLGDELGPDSQAISDEGMKKQGKHPLQWASLGMIILFQVLAVGTAVATIDASLRNMDDVSFFSELPVCNYFSLGVEDFENTNCSTYAQVTGKFQEDKVTLEKQLTAGLSVLIPKKIQVSNVLGSPDIQFIEQRTGDNRVSMTEMLSEFNRFKSTLGMYGGEDIDCRGYKLTEKGELELTCDFLGSSILSGDGKSKTSRQIALEFIDKISASDSRFKLLDRPSVLGMDTYTSTDLGLKGTFSTKTSIPMKLKYYPVSKL